MRELFGLSIKTALALAALSLVALSSLNACRKRHDASADSGSESKEVIGTSVYTSARLYGYLYTFESEAFPKRPLAGSTSAYNAFCLYRYVAEPGDPRTPEARFALAGAVTQFPVELVPLEAELFKLSSKTEDFRKKRTTKAQVINELTNDENDRRAADDRRREVNVLSLLDVMDKAASMQNRQAQPCPVKHPESPTNFTIIAK